MNLHRLSKLCLLTALAALGTGFGLDRILAAPPRPADAEQGVQVLTRGPVHEAFAETVTFDPEAGVVVPKAPPEAIEEVPPKQRPAGDNVAWIPGYFAWDDERDDFIWVSGIWRDLPPGREWVSGYWGQSRKGSQWTSGYWADAQASEVEYLPEPPQSVEEGPNIAAPSANHAWLPGSWLWQQNRYAWRPGFWSTVQPNWVWVPDHYTWTPRGYVYVDGYYDHSIDRRGILFAPVYFDTGVYSQRGFYYSPAIVIDLGLFTDHLFLRPRYHHYYFGDYYAASYYSTGFYPWFSFHNHGGYDPIFAHHRWQHRRNREWEQRVEANFNHRRNNEEDRPPHTLAALNELSRSGAKSTEKSRVVAVSLDQLAKRKNSSMRFQSLDKDEQQKLGQRGQELRKFREERQKLEISKADAPAEKPSTKPTSAKVKLPKSPITGKSADQLGKDRAPPKIYEAPKPDPKVEPRPRKTAGKSESSQGQRKGTTVRPGPDPPKGSPKVTKPEPKREAPKPKAESKEKPKAESKEKPKAEKEEKSKN